MSLPLQTKPLLAEGTGKKLVYRLSYPTGLSAAASTTLTGGTVTGTTTLATGATAAYLGLSEIGTSGYYVLTDGVISALPATDDEPYTVKVRQVDDAVDMTSYAAIAAGFEAATVTIWSEEPMPGAMAGGFVYGETWYADASNTALAAALSAVGEAVDNHAGGITVLTDTDAVLTTTSPTTDSDNGTVTIYSGAAYTGTGEGITKSRTWTGDSLDGATATLYVIRQDLYDDPTDATAWTALDTATVAQTDTTIAVSFNPDATATAALPHGANGDGSTRYRAHIVIAASKKPLWDFALIVKRGEWA